jgi:hypothetical protein
VKRKDVKARQDRKVRNEGKKRRAESKGGVKGRKEGRRVSNQTQGGALLLPFLPPSLPILTALFLA